VRCGQERGGKVMVGDMREKNSRKERNERQYWVVESAATKKEITKIHWIEKMYLF